MSNSSIVSLPPDLSDAVVLRRVLSVIIVRIDELLGTRDASNAAVNQNELESKVVELTALIEQATAAINDANNTLANLVNENEQTVEARIEANEDAISVLESKGQVRGALLRFKNIGGTLTLQVGRNVNTSSSGSSATGVYTVILDNSIGLTTNNSLISYAVSSATIVTATYIINSATSVSIELRDSAGVLTDLTLGESLDVVFTYKGEF